MCKETAVIKSQKIALIKSDRLCFILTVFWLTALNDAEKMLEKGLFYNTQQIARVMYLTWRQDWKHFLANNNTVMLTVFIRLFQNPHSIQPNNLVRLIDCNFCHVSVMDSWRLWNWLLWNDIWSCKCASRMFFIPSS